MRALIQRVRSAEVKINGEAPRSIGPGLLVYLAVEGCDSQAQAQGLAEKIATLRIFEDGAGKLNRDVLSVGGDVLAISNFTLLADARKGRRPSFTAAAASKHAAPLYEAFVASLEGCGIRVACGAFGKHMEIHSVADGPVNLIVEFPPAASERGGGG